MVSIQYGRRALPSGGFSWSPPLKRTQRMIDGMKMEAQTTVGTDLAGMGRKGLIT